MQAIVDAGIAGADVVAVISNRGDAAGLVFARERGIDTRIVDHKQFADRAAFDTALAATIDTFSPDLVVLAGFMRVLTDPFVLRYQGRLLNIHPSLLPAFSGLDTHRRAIEAGVRVHGATVHLVTPRLDAGPIVAQAVVPVLPGDDPAALAARVLREEHRLYPQVVRWFVEGRVAVDERGGVRVRGEGRSEQTMCVPQVDAG